jgi:hypothetical protein
MKMKNLILVLFLLFAASSFAGETCNEDVDVRNEDVVYTVNKDMPKYLEGATITVTLANGKSSTVPAEKFMVVPRVQKTVVGQNVLIAKKVTCSKSGNKNLLIGEVRKDVTGHETKTEAIPGGIQSTTSSVKEVVPGINYYRRELFDSSLGAGVGVDTNGTVKGLIGIEF